MSALAEFLSLGVITVTPGRVLKIPRSSVDWALLPSCPVCMPPWLPHRWTTKPVLAIPFLNCSKALSEKIAKVLAKGTFPDSARPAPTSAMFCSAMPRQNVRSGYSARKWQDFVDLPRSASSTTTRSSPAMSSSASP